MQTLPANKLNTFRSALLHLHKALLEFEKNQYEGKYGRVPSTGKMFDLVTTHADFVWLRTISELIVSLDELQETQEKSGEENVKDLFNYAKKLLSVSASASSFETKYQQAIRQDPAVALAHAKTIKILQG